LSERLTTTDELGNRVYLYPEDVKGPWKRRRQTVYAVLIFVFMVLPWFHFQGQQVILLDIINRKFIFFGHTFFGHDAPFLFFILLGFVLLMGLITALLGRVWCGWACPQTVFIQGVYSKIERWVEGSARKRQKRDQKPWNFENLSLKSLKWLLFTLVSLHLSHSFLGYFVGTRELLQASLQTPYENLGSFSAMLFFTGLFLFDFGWFREQFCIIACPYGRFQSVMMDEDSVVIAYDEKRGEPRRIKGLPRDLEGDCVNCLQCVRACPTGIDIREGAAQLECIACNQCIDACDDIMTRLNRPKGLIKYTTEKELKGEKTQWVRPRSIIYATLLTIVLVAFALSLETRQDLDAVIIRKGSTPFQVLEKGKTLLNRFSIKLSNNTNSPMSVSISAQSVSGEKLEIAGQTLDFKLKEGHGEKQFFIKFPPQILTNGSAKAFINIEYSPLNKGNEQQQSKEISLVGPR
jgi:cytochrome c oxidase accessory protein FixG